MIGIAFFLLQRLIESGTIVFNLDPVALAWLPTALLAAVTLLLLARARSGRCGCECALAGEFLPGAAAGDFQGLEDLIVAVVGDYVVPALHAGGDLPGFGGGGGRGRAC